MTNSIIEVNSLGKSYGNQTILNNLDMRVEEGTITALLGPNGAGKTTLVRILSTLTRFDQGTATIAGHDVQREPAAVRNVISLTGQYAAIDELLTGEENLILAGRLWHLNPHEARSRSHELLERFDLTGSARKRTRSYSGGMKRKLDLAMSLMGQPQVLFLDEPTTGLDPRSRSALWETVRELRATGVTVFLTTQYLDEADQLADHITIIDQGRTVAEGPADVLKSQMGQNLLILGFRDHRTTMRAALALRDQSIVPTSDNNTIQVAVDGTSSHLFTVLSVLKDASITTESTEIHEPTLDDVFLTLTENTTLAQVV